MGKLTAYFNRILVWLVSGFVMLVAGLLASWILGVVTLDQIGGEVTDNIDDLYESVDVGQRLQVCILDQIAAGERDLIAAEPERQARLRRLGGHAHARRARCQQVSGMTP